MEDCEHCINESRIASLEEDVKRNSQTHREFYDRFEQQRVDTEVAKSNMNNLLTLMTEIKNDVKELKDKPGKRWDTVIGCVISVAVTILVTLALTGKF